ncbi:MAG: TetR/AcrR family transcriptional regulator C-terminal domain-containing protein [Solirubrobacterales bacterium]
MSPRASEETTTRRRLSRERVVAAALRIVDRDGLKGLTMRALGRELGVDPMAVYHWVPRKNALLDLIVEAVFREIPLDAEMPPGGWRKEFGFAASVFRDTLRRHPNALSVLATRPGVSPAAMAPAEFAMGILREAGFSAADAMYGVSAMSSLVIGLVLAEVGIEPAWRYEDRANLLGQLPAEDFPNIVEAASTVEFDFDRLFGFGMEALMRGMEPLGSADV